MKGFRPEPYRSAPARTPANARAYAELRRRILHGELPAGTVVNEAELAATLDVSRTPVREALRELLSEGLVNDTGPRRQAVVATVSPELHREVFLMRSALERIAVREAATTMDLSEVDQLRLIMIRARRAIQAGDVNAFLDCDDEFHLHIARAAGLLLVEDVLRRLRGATRLVSLGLVLTREQLEHAADEHDIIIEALDSGDPDAAEAATDAHLSASAEAMATAATH